MHLLLLLASAQLALLGQGPTVLAPAPASTEGAEVTVSSDPEEEASAAEPAAAADAEAEKEDAPQPPEEADAAAGPRFYVVDPHVVGMPEAVQGTISSAIAQTLEEQRFESFSRDDVRAIMGQAGDLAVLDADADQLSLGTLGKAVGANWIVACTVTKLDDGDIAVQMRLIDVNKATAAARRETRASDFGDDILAATKDATRLVLAPLFAHMLGSLAITVSEEGADVLVDGQQHGVTPLRAPIALSGGHHVLTIAKSGFVRHQETLRVEQGSALTRDVVLRPSRDFLVEYRAENELYRTLAWVSTGAAVALAGVGVGFGVGYLYKAQEAQELVAARDRVVEDEQLNPNVPTHQTRIQELEDPIEPARVQATVSSIVGISGGALAVAAGALAAYFWIFGDDPGRYDEVADEYGIE